MHKCSLNFADEVVFRCLPMIVIVSLTYGYGFQYAYNEFKGVSSLSLKL